MTKLHLAIRPLRLLLVALFAALVMFQAVILPGTFWHIARESPDHAHLKWPLLAGLFLYVTPQLDDPGVPVLMMMLLLSGAGVGFLTVVMRALLRRATVLRTTLEALL